MVPVQILIESEFEYGKILIQITISCCIRTGKYKGLNEVKRQASNSLKFNREPSKNGNFYHQPSQRAIIIRREKVLRS